MGVWLALGYGLIAGGPALVLYCRYIGPKAFLILLSLASAFQWLVVLLVISALFKAWTPLAGAGILAVAIIVSVAVEEAVRYGLWHFHKRLVNMLKDTARGRQDIHVTNTDVTLLALTQGMGHGTAHATFLYFSWLPLALGSGTFYTDACPQMSYFFAGALLTLAFSTLHACSMLIAFSCLSEGKTAQYSVVPVVHLATSLLTLGNFAYGGCLVVIPVVLIVAGLSAMWAAWLASSRARSHAPVV